MVDHPLNKQAVQITQVAKEELSLHRDNLTGLPNRVAYSERILDAYHRWQRGFGDLSLALADIDYLKNINETYGEAMGDQILKKLASIFMTSIRKADFVARYDGGEFVFIFERTHQQQAATILESLRCAIEQCGFHSRKTRIAVTVSFGLTTLLQEDELEGLFARADKAMYLAKHSGRNQITTL